MAFRAIFFETLLHAWRLKLPFIILASIILLVLSLPAVLKGDGTTEGKIKVFMMYGGHLQIFIVCLTATAWSIWLDKLEKDNNVHILLATKPVSRFKILFSRTIATTFISLLFITAFSSTLTLAASKGIINQDNSEKKISLNTLFEVYQEKALFPDKHFEETTIRGKKKQVIAFEFGKTISFPIAIKKLNQQFRLRGTLRGQSDGKEGILRCRIIKENNVLWARQLPIKTNREFILMLPSQLYNIGPVTLEMTHLNKNKSPVYFLSNQPFLLSIYYGPLWHNLTRGSIQILILVFVLVAISMLLCQFLSIQGTLLGTLFLYIIGFFKSNIHAIIFPEATFYPGMAVKDTTLIDIFYLILWKPILFIIPNFGNLNPTSSLISGSLITTEKLLDNIIEIIPLLLIITFICKVFLPKQELASLKKS